jgi:hypothetical protein
LTSQIRRLGAPSLIVVGILLAACNSGGVGGSSATPSLAATTAQAASTDAGASAGGSAGASASASDATGSASTSAAPSDSGLSSGAPGASGATASGATASGATASGAPAGSGGTAAGPADCNDPTTVLPAQVGETPLTGTTVDAQTYAAVRPARQVLPLLTALGADPTQVKVVMGSGLFPSSTVLVDAVCVPDADASKLQTTVSGLLEKVPGSGAKSGTVGGKSVITLPETGGGTTDVYARDGVIYFVQAQDPKIVEQVLGALS